MVEVSSMEARPRTDKRTTASSSLSCCFLAAWGEQFPWSHTLSMTHCAAVRPNTTGRSEPAVTPLITRASSLPAFDAVYLSI